MSVAGASGGSGGGGFGGGGGPWGGGGGGGCGDDGGGKKGFPPGKGLAPKQTKGLAEKSERERAKASADDLLAEAKTAAVAAAQEYADVMSQLGPVAGKQPGTSSRVREAQELAAAVATIAAVLEQDIQSAEDTSECSELTDKFKDLSTK